ncbi:acyltransferase [Oscillatoria sp. CS-180]|uniref:acyltransferase n=1 Tax=Oscillatoria sp. CS-180 TaxID=3021720 RepID=UPI00233010FB|nr:acyltransferase [Oscillatoria sp. CS-180]MDB9526591.1 acyltransferase [Oscillatoria sp. CS-180]
MTSDDIKVISKVPLSEQLGSTNTSLLKRYQSKVLGNSTVFDLIRYELATLLFANLPGSLGYVFRKRFFKSLFRQFGSGVILGQSVVLRHPNRISLGDRVAIDDGVLLDASGAGDAGLVFGNDVIVSRNCVVQGKTGSVKLGAKVDIGCNVILSSGNGIIVGNSVLIAGNCYIGGGRYITDRTDIPMMEQGVYSKGPVVIEDDVWLGAGATVLDGVRIGRGSVIGAGALVTKDLPEYSVAIGVPAKVVKSRK